MSQRSLNCSEPLTKFSRRIQSPRGLTLLRWGRRCSICLKGGLSEISDKQSSTLSRKVDPLMIFKDSLRTRGRNNFLIWSLSTLSIASERRHALRRMLKIYLSSVLSTSRALTLNKPLWRNISQMPWSVGWELSRLKPPEWRRKRRHLRLLTRAWPTIKKCLIQSLACRTALKVSSVATLSLDSSNQLHLSLMKISSWKFEINIK
jgi:hypothetical protein